MKQHDAYRVAREIQLLSNGRMEAVFHGLSMDPLLFEGDSVVVEPVEIIDVAIGDVVTYRQDDKYPTRRVVGRDSNGLVLWCDAWPNMRFRADHEDVLGRVVARVRNGHELAASSPEWMGRRDRALRSYRRARVGLEARRLVHGVRRRLRVKRWGR